MNANAKKWLDDGFPAHPIESDGRRKAPTVTDWQKRTFTLSDFPNDAGVGVRLDDLIITDAENEHTATLANLLLLNTGRIHGRASCPDSHRWYRGHSSAKYRRFEDIEKDATGKHKTVFEILTGNGRQVV